MFRVIANPIAFGILYSIAFNVGMCLYFEPANVSALWPASGIALVFVLRTRLSRCWLYLILVFVVHLVSSWNLGSPGYVIGVAVAAVAETGLVVIVRRCIGTELIDVGKVKGLLQFFGIAVMASACGASIGAGAVVWFVPGVGEYRQIWQTWCLADLTGMILIVPCALNWLSIKRLSEKLSPIQTMENVLLLFLIGLLGWHLFLRPSTGVVTALDMPYIIIPFLVWIALRSTPAIVSTVGALIGFIVVIGADLGLGPFYDQALSPDSMALSSQIFIATVLITPLVLATAISERRADIALRLRSEENLRATLKSIGDAVISTDINGRINSMNLVAEEITGWSLHDAEGQRLEAVYQPLDAYTRELLNSLVPSDLTNGRSISRGNHLLFIDLKGDEHRLVETASPIISDDGAINGIVLVLRDITKEHALQERLQQAEKLQVVGHLAGGVAHDFNNMLGGIMGAAELLGRGLPEGSTLKKYHSMIAKSAEQAAGLTQQLLTFSRKQPLSSSAIRVHGAINDAVALLRNTLNPSITINLALMAEKDLVIGDHSQLQNIFLNLGINASHAMPDGGFISVSSDTVSLDRHYCKTSTFDIKEGAYLEIEFRDSGNGISAENLPRIFDPFFTTKEQGEGTGLGLATVFGTVQQHRGAITVYSEIETGTHFHILLPLSKEDVTTGSITPQAIRGTGTILIVDDEPVMRTTAKAILEDLGYDVLLAENGKAGLSIFAEDPGGIALVVLDMIMPEMNGRDCFIAIRKLKPDARIILASGFSREKDIDEMMSAGLCGFIRKPYGSAALSQVIHDALKA